MVMVGDALLQKSTRATGGMGLEWSHCSVVPLSQVISNVVHKGIDRLNICIEVDMWDGLQLFSLFFFFFFFLLRAEQIIYPHG